MKQFLTRRNRFDSFKQTSRNLSPVRVSLTKAELPKSQSDKAINRGRPMFNLNTLKFNLRQVAALGAVAVGALAFSGSALAAQPTLIFPFFLPPPTQAAQAPVETAPARDGR